MSDVTEPKRGGRNARNLGPLHALILKGLPEWRDESGLLMTKVLAEKLEISYQALYQVFKRESISMRHVLVLIELSRATELPPEDFTPLKMEDFVSFLR